MKILKHGKVPRRIFTCPNCNCVFAMALSEIFPPGMVTCPEDKCQYNFFPSIEEAEIYTEEEGEEDDEAND